MIRATIPRAVSLLAAVVVFAAGLAGCGDNTAEKEYETPCIIKTVYPTDDVVIADVVATNAAFGADPTGERDSTGAIQDALNACRKLGGGTVWMPAGRYRITGTLTVPSFVTLRGDWQDPDTGNRYGTILLMDIPPVEEGTRTGSIYIGGSAGVMGLTVYYPHQSLEDVKPYPFTFYVTGQGDGYMLQSIVNCTLINAYQGIGACVGENTPHEMMTVENVKGTVLSCGAEAYNQADVGTWKNLVFGPQYWAGAGKGMEKADETALRAYMRANATGLRLGDLEWTQFAGLRLSDFSIGIHLVKGKRIQFAGSLYDVSITGCGTALLAEDMDPRWGTVIARGVLSGEKSLVNQTEGVFRLADVALEGASSGVMEQEAVDSACLPDVPCRAAPKPAARLRVVEADKTGKTDISVVLQEALDAMEKKGGVVYLPAGLYRLDTAVRVPAGVELRGASSVGQRDQYGSSKGTLILAYAGSTDSLLDADEAEALVTLAGEKAGVRGVRFLYPETINRCSKGEEILPGAYTIRGRAAEVYAVNVAITGGFNGIDFRDCDRHIIKRFVGCCLYNAMTVGGKDGLVEGCLQNGNALCRMGLPAGIVSPVREADVFADVFDPITRVQTEFLRIAAGSSGQTVCNTFAYGVKTFAAVYDSSAVLFNIGADNIGTSAPMLRLTGGETTVVNMLRYNGLSYELKNGSLRLYNRLTISEKDERQHAVETPH